MIVFDASTIVEAALKADRIPNTRFSLPTISISSHFQPLSLLK
jgi:hypothetical protein